MEEMDMFLGKTVRVVLDNGYIYGGPIINVSSQSITIHDTKTDHDIYIGINNINSMEVLE